ncbi:hypothetical protein A2U01_0024255 [Trifolium medium]|uniref:Secreted protein n=1 Tax=Trifolium medium TaxID=97028 RepID=A0A392NVI5_9FABA|nr:hypothetical protein [Trifolium medium]
MMTLLLKVVQGFVIGAVEGQVPAVDVEGPIAIANEEAEVAAVIAAQVVRDDDANDPSLALSLAPLAAAQEDDDANDPSTSNRKRKHE